MQDIIMSPIRLRDLEALIERSVSKALSEKAPSEINSSTNEGFMTAHQAADLLNLSLQTLYHKTMKKEIPFHKAQGAKRVYFLRSELESWIKSGGVSPQPSEQPTQKLIKPRRQRMKKRL